MTYSVSLGAWGAVFAVPAEVVDSHLRLAGGAQLKVLLYMLRNSGNACSPQQLSHELGLGLADVADALDYWVRCGLFAAHEGQLTIPEGDSPTANDRPVAHSRAHAEPPQTGGQQVPPCTAQPERQEQPEQPTMPLGPTPKKKEHIRYSYSECCELISQQSELSDMLNILEGLMCRQLNHTEISVFTTLATWYGLPPACVVVMTEYCISSGHSSISYIERTGTAWANEEINTIEKANAKILHLRTAKRSWELVRTALDIPERKPTPNEETCCTRWVNEWQCSIELIKLAYYRCVDAKGKLNMSYMNGILKRWHENGVTTEAMVLELDAAHTENAVKSEKQPRQSASPAGRYSPTYDKDEIESILDSEWLDGE